VGQQNSAVGYNEDSTTDDGEVVGGGGITISSTDFINKINDASDILTENGPNFEHGTK
jgi:hypothetical protein